MNHAHAMRTDFDDNRLNSNNNFNDFGAVNDGEVWRGDGISMCDGIGIV